MIDLDHVALAARDIAQPLGVLVGDLGATPMFGGNALGFRFVQVRVGDAARGMTVELLEPWGIEANDFLARFLDGREAGAHHLTFKVDDLGATLERVGSAGYRPVSVDLSDPEWKEAFLHPREAHGTVVQLAEARGVPSLEAVLAHARAQGPEGHPRWWPDPPEPHGPMGLLRRVVLATPSLPAAVAFFAGVLRGREAAGGEGWLELEWAGGGRVRLEHRADAAPGIDRLEVEGLGDAAEERHVAGTRLVTVAPGERT